VSERDYYDILDVGRDADLVAIKKAYRAAALRYHPDKNPGDKQAEERFKEAAEAYAILSDPEKRKLYDQFGKASLGSQAGQGFDQEIFADFGDILGDLFGFGSVFGGGRRARRGRAGRDLRYDLEIDFEEAVRGLETQIKLPILETCKTCSGRGAPEDGIETCRQCGGRGQVAFQQGFFTIARSCGQCGGTGKRIVKPCRDCAGEGRVRRESTLQIRIPPGVDSGTQLRMSGRGEAGASGGPHGDLYVVLRVREHELFERHDRDIVCQAPISFSQAALGAELTVPTIDGDRKLSIPAGTHSGTSFCLKGLGVPTVNGSDRGDHYVTVRVRTPTRLNDEQRKLLEELAKIEGEETLEPGLFERVKSIFN